MDVSRKQSGPGRGDRLTSVGYPPHGECDQRGRFVISAGQPGGNGTQINPGTVITSTQTIYFYYQTTISPICTVDTSFEVTILPRVEVGTRPDVFECTSYTLPPITVGKYYTQAYGNGTILEPGTVITQTTTLFVYETTGGEHPCTDLDVFKTIFLFPSLAFFLL